MKAQEVRDLEVRDLEVKAPVRIVRAAATREVTRAARVPKAPEIQEVPRVQEAKAAIVARAPRARAPRVLRDLLPKLLELLGAVAATVVLNHRPRLQAPRTLALALGTLDLGTLAPNLARDRLGLEVARQAQDQDLPAQAQGLPGLARVHLARDHLPRAQAQDLQAQDLPAPAVLGSETSRPWELPCNGRQLPCPPT